MGGLFYELGFKRTGLEHPHKFDLKLVGERDARPNPEAVTREIHASCGGTEEEGGDVALLRGGGVYWKYEC
jgi:hypothetical protein